MGSSSGQSNSYDLSFKILLIGDSAVGKSSLLLSFISDSVDELAPTIGNLYAHHHFLCLLTKYELRWSNFFKKLYFGYSINEILLDLVFLSPLPSPLPPLFIFILELPNWIYTRFYHLGSDCIIIFKSLKSYGFYKFHFHINLFELLISQLWSLLKGFLMPRI